MHIRCDLTLSFIQEWPGSPSAGTAMDGTVVRPRRPLGPPAVALAWPCEDDSGGSTFMASPSFAAVASAGRSWEGGGDRFVGGTRVVAAASFGSGDAPAAGKRLGEEPDDEPGELPCEAWFWLAFSAMVDDAEEGRMQYVRRWNLARLRLVALLALSLSLCFRSSSFCLKTWSLRRNVVRGFESMLNTMGLCRER